jgi:hypothetical protein
VIKVESLEATMADLAAAGLDVEAPDSPDGSDDFLTTWITDPDGNRIELVQWPAGHADGITAADWPGRCHPAAAVHVVRPSCPSAPTAQHHRRTDRGMGVRPAHRARVANRSGPIRATTPRPGR